MTTSNQLQNAIDDRSSQNNQKVKLFSTSKIPIHLSADSMRLLLDKVREGERNTARTIISATLNVNDVVAEYCLRHLEEKIREEQDYEHKVFNQITNLTHSPSQDLLKFLQYTFGVQGVVSRAILNHIRTVGA